MSARRLTSLTYGMLTEYATSEQRAELDAWLAGPAVGIDFDLLAAIGGEIG